MKKLLFLLIAFCPFILSAEIIAYPVPFDPSKETLTITDKLTSYASLNCEFDFSVYDINGDVVVSRKYSSLPIKWKGYKGNGKKVSTGFYIICVKVLNIDTGDVLKKNIRILVKRK